MIPDEAGAKEADGAALEGKEGRKERRNTTTHRTHIYHTHHTTHSYIHICTYISTCIMPRTSIPGLDSKREGERERERKHALPWRQACVVFGHVLVAINIYVISHQLRGRGAGAMEPETGNNLHLTLLPPPLKLSLLDAHPKHILFFSRFAAPFSNECEMCDF